MEKQTTTGLPWCPQAALGAPGWPHTDTLTEATSVWDAAPAQVRLPSFLPPSLSPAYFGHSSPDSKGCKNAAASPNAARSQWNKPYQTTGQQVPLFPSAVQTTASYWQRCKSCWALVVYESMNSVYKEVPSGSSKGLERKRSSFVCHLKDKIKEESLLERKTMLCPLFEKNKY